MIIHMVLLYVVPAFWLGIVGGGFYFVRRYVRAVEGRAHQDRTVAALEARVASLEAQFDDMERNVERLENGQEFTTRLLGDRPNAPVPRDRAEAAGFPHRDA